MKRRFSVLFLVRLLFVFLAAVGTIGFFVFWWQGESLYQNGKYVASQRWDAIVAKIFFFGGTALVGGLGLWATFIPDFFRKDPEFPEHQLRWYERR